jgi:hypothetical protein
MAGEKYERNNESLSSLKSQVDFVCNYRRYIQNLSYLNAVEQILKIKGRHEKKAFRRLYNVLLTLFDMHLSKIHIRLKVPSGVYGLSFVAF